MPLWLGHNTLLQDQDNLWRHSPFHHLGTRRRRRCSPQASWVPRKSHRPSSMRLRGNRSWCRTWCLDPRKCRPPNRNRWRANLNSLPWPGCSRHRRRCSRFRCTRFRHLARSPPNWCSRRRLGCCRSRRGNRRRGREGIRHLCTGHCPLRTVLPASHSHLMFLSRRFHWEGSTRQGFGCRTNSSRWPA